MNLFRNSLLTCSVTVAAITLFQSLNAIPANATAGAQDTDTGRVFPVTTPVPAPTSKPETPEQITDSNANVLSLDGSWKFAITRGQTIGGIYISTADLNKILSVSSTSGGVGYWNGGAVLALDGDIGTKWTASDTTTPQWLKIDLGSVETLTGVTLEWGDPRMDCCYIVEGSLDGVTWFTLSDQSAPAAQYAGGGEITFPAIQSRFIRVTISHVTQQDRRLKPGDGPPVVHHPAAQIAEIGAMVVKDGVSVPWTPTESTDGFEAPSFDDTTWNLVTVPSNWEIAGYSRPTYNDVDDAVGEYRRSVMIPKSFAGKSIFWRFDGVYDGADIYVNGVKAGYHESGYTAFDVDVTGLLVPGSVNVFAVRACKKTSSIDLDTGDYEAMGGIYRETFLYATPSTHIKDVTIRTTPDKASGAWDVSADIAVTGLPKPGDVVDAKLVGPDGAVVGVPAFQTLSGKLDEDSETVSINIPVSKAKLWSAEKPNLYTMVFILDSASGDSHEIVQEPVGIRQITISPDQVLLWNGVPIKLAGTARHEIWPNLGAALNDTVWTKDITLIKQANINAVRTSHYNDARRFLDLCESNGLYILDEVPYCWVNEKTDDIRYQPAFIQRARETFARDKNRPEVLAWSCGNENPGGQNTVAVALYMHAHDPTRPAFSSSQWAGLPGQSFTDIHYPAPKDLPHIIAVGGKTTPILFSEQPHMISAPENITNDPGLHDFWGVALSRSWNVIEANPKIIGSFIWEWQNQPVLSNWSDSTPNHLGPTTVWFENNKGVVDGFRNPKPEYWNVKEIYSPIQIAQRTVVPLPGSNTKTQRAAISVENRYSFTNLSEVACTWTALKNNAVVGTGSVPLSCPPLSKTQIYVPVSPGATDIRVKFINSVAKCEIYSSLLHVGFAPLPQPPAAANSGVALTYSDQGTQFEIKNADEIVDISKANGQITRWNESGREVFIGGPTLNLGQDHPETEQYGISSKGFVDSKSVVAEANPAIRLEQDAKSVVVSETIKLDDATGALAGSEGVTYIISPDSQIGVSWNVSWDGADTRAFADGMQLTLSPLDTHLTWCKESPLPDYPADHIGAPIGSTDSPSVSYNSSRHGLHWLAVSDKTKHGLALISADSPLIGRIHLGSYAPILYADTNEAADCELSSPWLADQDVVLTKAKPLSGSFILRAF